MEALKKQDVWAGVLLCAIGGIAFAAVQDLPVGTAGRMGPGYVPRGLSLAVLGFGLIIGLRGFVTENQHISIERLRPFVCITLAILSFALLFSAFGFLPAMAAMVLLSMVGGNDLSARQYVIYCAILGMICFVTFRLVVGMNFAMIEGVW